MFSNCNSVYHHYIPNLFNISRAIFFILVFVIHLAPLLPSLNAKLICIPEKSPIPRIKFLIKFLFAMVNFLVLLVRSIYSRYKMAAVSFPAGVIIDRNVTVLTYIAVEL